MICDWWKRELYYLQFRMRSFLHRLHSVVDFWFSSIRVGGSMARLSAALAPRFHLFPSSSSSSFCRFLWSDRVNQRCRDTAISLSFLLLHCICLDLCTYTWRKGKRNISRRRAEEFFSCEGERRSRGGIVLETSSEGRGVHTPRGVYLLYTVYRCPLWLCGCVTTSLFEDSISTVVLFLSIVTSLSSSYVSSLVSFIFLSPFDGFFRLGTFIFNSFLVSVFFVLPGV